MSEEERRLHERWMRLALVESEKALPECVPNPPVGCVVVQSGRLVRILKSLLAILFLAVAIPCLVAPAYDYPPPQAFAGPAFWNPYASFDGTWQRTNLHAHGRAWSGVTNGQQTDAAVVDAYRKRGYDVAGVSDYQWIAAQHGVDTLPLYEHGYNIAKAHQLAIGAQRVEWLDFPLWQGLNQKQFLIDRVARTAALVSINHPDTAYTEEDLQHLTGYQLMEVVNGPFAFERLWDAALSSGHVAWSIGDDDNHDVTDAARFGVAYTMIGASSPDLKDILSALRQGRAYTVSARSESPDATLTGVNVQASALTISISGAPATFSFVGQDGVVRCSVEHATEATYLISPRDTYIRTVIRTPNLVMYVNPVIRYNGSALPAPVAPVDPSLTWLGRSLVMMAGVAATLALRQRVAT